jgi:hypothetical protein
MITRAMSMTARRIVSSNKKILLKTSSCNGARLTACSTTDVGGSQTVSEDNRPPHEADLL